MTVTAARPAAGRLFSRPAAAAACAAFVLIGALQALYGPAVPALRAVDGLSPASTGLALSLHFTGGVAGVLAFDAVHTRISNRLLLTAGYVLMAGGAAGFAPGPVSWIRPDQRAASGACDRKAEEGVHAVGYLPSPGTGGTPFWAARCCRSP
ncbi:hypothetical protein ACFYV5_31530 [Streptomyces sp. NPDC003035]|uniref:hypothetical protein n=1 Tax=Streptomyces sp. NPDC003035 TaxID=3364676 RepID=UPI003687B9E3